MASSRDRRPSEFGGVPGLTPPAPYDLDSATQARLERATNADDATDTKDKALLRELTREGRA